MKIVFFSVPMLEHGGGSEVYYVNVAARLKRDYPTHEVSIVTFGDKLFRVLLTLLSIYYLKNVLRDGGHRTANESLNEQLGGVQYHKCDSMKLIRKYLKQADVIYSRNEIIDLLVLQFIGYKNLPNVLLSVHTPIFYPYTSTMRARLHNFLYLGPIYKYLISGVRAVKVANQEDALLMEGHFKIKQVFTIMHPFEASATGIYKPLKKGLNLVFIGRLTEQKGIDILIDCIEGLSENRIFNNISFSVAGDGDQKLMQALTELSRKYSNVSYLGHLGGQEVSKLYSRSDAVLIPSRFETVNQVALEAGSAKAIVIASDIPGPREVVEDGVTGFLVEPVAEAFTKKILYLYDLKKEDPDSFYGIGERASQYIAKKFNSRAQQSELMKALKTVSGENAD